MLAGYGKEKKNAPRNARGVDWLFNFGSDRHGLRDHIFEQYLDRHGVATAAMGQEKLTVTLKRTGIEGNMVVIVIAMKRHVELVETKAVAILRITLGLLELSDQTIVHRVLLLGDK
jgi:hypothetical protein